MDNILIEQLVDRIMTDPELQDEDKKSLLSNLAKRGVFTPGFYFHEAAQDKEAIEVWYVNEDEDGTKHHGNTGWNDPKMVIIEYLRAKQVQQQK